MGYHLVSDGSPQALPAEDGGPQLQEHDTHPGAAEGRARRRHPARVLGISITGRYQAIGNSDLVVQSYLIVFIHLDRV